MWLCVDMPVRLYRSPTVTALVWFWQGSLAAPAEEMCTLPFLQLVERCLMVKGVAMFNVLYDGRGADSRYGDYDAVLYMPMEEPPKAVSPHHGARAPIQQR